MFKRTRNWHIHLGLILAGLGIIGQSEFLRAQTGSTTERAAIRVLIVDGQNNHAIWPKTSEMMRGYLLETKLFTVDLARTVPKGMDENFLPDFSKYDVVISNYNGESWPLETQKAFEHFVADGGGLVVIHAADNAFPEWTEYNRMIGLGGWGDRSEANGPYVYYNDESKLIRDGSAGNGGSHGAQHEFVVTVRNAEHPITKGMPKKWLHAKDELYDRLRGPGENLEVLASALASKDQGGSGRHEPMVMVVSYGQGRVFHTTLGHADYSQACVGFITLLTRGTEWAATGKVTIPLPSDFPTESKSISRMPKALEAAEEKIIEAKLGTTPNVTRFGSVFFAGQLVEEEAQILKDNKVKTIITLRKDGEVKWDEKAWAEKNGFTFLTFPCRQVSELNPGQLEELYKALESGSESERVVLHCGSANRVGAVWALYCGDRRGLSLEQALEEGKQIGLRSPQLENEIRKRLEKK